MSKPNRSLSPRAVSPPGSLEKAGKTGGPGTFGTAGGLALALALALWGPAGCAGTRASTTPGAVPAAGAGTGAPPAAGKTAPGTAAAPAAVSDAPVVWKSGPIPASPAPSGPAVTSDEDAERARQEVDALDEADPARRGRRQAIINYYARAAQASLDQGHPDEAYASFTSALALFDPSELQDPSHPPAASELLPIAQQIDRAYSKRGAHTEAVVALMVQRTLRAGDPQLQLRYAQLERWMTGLSDGVQNLMRGRGRSLAALLADPPATLESDLAAAYRLWPSVVTRAELLKIYRQEAADQNSGTRRTPKDFLQSLSSTMKRKGSLVNGPAWKIARLYLRASQAPEAVAEIKRLGKLSPEEGKILALLEETLGSAPVSTGDAGEGDRLLGAVQLAMAVAQNPEDADVGLQMCRDVAQRAPRLVAAHLCTAEIGITLERKSLAMRALERAKTLVPTERGIWEKLGLLYVDRLSDLVSDERTTELESALREIEAYYARMSKQFPGAGTAEDLGSTGLAVALAEVGRGYYNAGRIDDTLRYLERSIALQANASALELLGTIQLRRGQLNQAVATLERARAVQMSAPQGDPALKAFFGARVGRLIADALDQQPDAGGPRTAAEVRRLSIKTFDGLISSNRLPPERLAEAELERGKLLYQAGERDPALEAFQRASDALPENDEHGRGPGQLYADLIAFLVQRGELDEAIDMYHRSLGRGRLIEALKVYCSMWLADLLQRAGQPPDPLATNFLQSVQGTKWHADLARWASGTLTEAALLQRADTPGKQAEANFYLGLSSLRAGNKAAAEARFRKVVASNMMGFFEYEMATAYLKRGAPAQPVLKSKAAPPARTGKAPPPGSI